MQNKMICDSLSQLRRLRKNQYLSVDELRNHQDNQLRKIVNHAYCNLAYYRDLFDTVGLKPQDINSIDDLYKIPITTKRSLQEVPSHEIIAQGADTSKCVVKHTSGSTGQPLKMFLSPGERDFQILLNLRILIENGLRISDKVAYLINPHRFPKSKYWFQRMGILRREYLSVFDFPEKHVECLMKIKPDIIYGYPSNLTLLALYIREKGITSIRPKMIFSVAEALEPRAKNLIDSIMHVNTCDILGTIELGDIAWQCEKREGYHTSADAVIIEFLKDGRAARPGEEGRIVCTSLYGYTMPLIRYAVDDICVPSDRICPCGRNLPMMERIQGRANDFIVLPDGQIVASCFLVITMQAFHDIAQYRVVQVEKDRLTVQIVKGKNFGDGNESKLKSEIGKAVHGKIGVEVEVVENIPRDSSGKIRTVVSHIVPNLQKNLDQDSGIFLKE